MDCNQRCLQVVGLADLNHQNHWEDCLTSIAVVTATMAFWQHRKDYSSYLLVSLKALPRYFAASGQNGHSSPSKVITSLSLNSSKVLDSSDLVMPYLAIASSLNSSFASYFAFELTFVAFEDCYYFHSSTLLPFTIEALPSAIAALPLDLVIIVVVMQVVNSLHTSIVHSCLELVAKLKAYLRSLRMDQRSVLEPS